MADPRRILGFEGAANFRDAGGYRTADGLRVRWGHLFRSGRLSALSEVDRDRLDGLGITTIFDLRARAEREKDPTCWSRDGLVTQTYRPGHKRRLVDMALDYPASAEGALALMRDFYAEMPETMAHIFGEMIAAIADGASPCIIHCSAGKDRTGMAVALLLAALGVPRETIVEDYVLTGSIARPQGEMANAVVRARDEGAFARFYPPEAIAVMMAADADYIEAALDAIERRHGSLAAFLRDRLGLDETSIEQLRSRLLEPPTTM